MKIRTEDRTIYHLNDYHFIHLFRNVDVRRIGQSNTKHVVLLDNFRDWENLVATAERKENGVEFKLGLYWFLRKDREIYPASGPNYVELNRQEIESIVMYLTNDTDVPDRLRNERLNSALAVAAGLAKSATSTELAFRWPTRLPGGVSHKVGTQMPTKKEHFVWGPNGHIDFPHIHCFVDGDGDLYEARATLRPLAGEKDKRGFVFRQDLTVDRDGGPLSADDPALSELEKVLSSVVYGHDLVVTAAAAAEAEAQEFAAFAEAIEDGRGKVLNPEWVKELFAASGLTAADLVDYKLAELESFAQVGPVNAQQWVPKRRK